jgi:hypothetical protein
MNTDPELLLIYYSNFVGETRNFNSREKLHNCSVVLEHLDVKSILRSGVYLSSDSLRCIDYMSTERSAESNSMLRDVKQESSLAETSAVDESNSEISHVDTPSTDEGNKCH